LLPPKIFEMNSNMI